MPDPTTTCSGECITLRLNGEPAIRDKKLNDDEDEVINKRWIVGSLDIEALYPSLDIDVCAGITSRVLCDSYLQFQNLQWREIMLYLRHMMTDAQMEMNNMVRYAPERRTCRGRPPMFTAPQGAKTMWKQGCDHGASSNAMN